MTSDTNPGAAHGAAPTVQGIDDVVVSGTTAPHDWDERIFAGRSAGGLAPRPLPDARPRPKPADPGLARAMRAMQR